MKKRIHSQRRLRLAVLILIPVIVLGALAVWAVRRATDAQAGSDGEGAGFSPVPAVSAAVPETLDGDAGKDMTDAGSEDAPDDAENTTDAGPEGAPDDAGNTTDAGPEDAPDDAGKDTTDAGSEGVPDVTPQPAADTVSKPGAEAGSEDGEEYSSAVRELLAGMTLREKVCQMMLVTPSALTGVSKVTSAGETTRAALEKYPVGGLDYNKSNMVSKQQVAQMLADVQSYSRIPLILTCDEEGGRVARLMNTIGTTWVDAMLDYKDDGPEVARSNALTIAQDMSALGFNMDLAPVADVWSNPENTVIGDRAYSDDFDQAVSLLPSAVAGFQEGGVACVIKHFPGHGDSSADSHYGSVYIYKTLDQLRAQELRPFQAAIDAGADAVMMGHLIVQDVSEEPAVFSYEMVTELLREEMGFQGVVMTDALNMKAISDHYTNAQVAVMAVQAGVDMLLCPMDLDGAIEALVSAVESGEIEESRIDESVLRILQLKENRGIL